ncbi:membrane protein insertion efficiency factor YidD [Candidatus Gracilibacteria bacterium]|nr:membrane protein insertion efficiency factor YidD [Candidatus Gracilibacteria bacterium]
MRTIKKIIRWPFIAVIKLYQKTLSPDHGPMKVLFPEGYCKFSPTCSEYTKQAIEKHGVLWGGLKGTWRILRCNPCSRGGVDQV